jgi:hypothetical protein
VTAIAVGVLAVALVFVALVLAGVVRSMAELGRRVTALEEDATWPHRLAGGLSIGAPAPSLDLETVDGGRFRSVALSGRSHVIALADPGCEACEDLVPELLSAAAAERVPPVVAIAGSSRVPDGWFPPVGATGIAVVGLDPDGTAAEAFGSGFTPHVFIVDAGGSIAAHGPASSLADVGRLIRDADGIGIVAQGAADA